MAQYTRSAAEQFRPEETAVGWLWNVFIFSVVVFGSVLLLYAGIEFGYGAFLANESEQIQSEIDVLAGEVSAEDRQRLTDFYSQVYNVDELLSGHVLASRLFAFLEANTNKQVSYESMDFTKSTNALALEGESVSYELIAKQLEALRRRPEVAEVVLSKSQREENGSRISFILEVLLDERFLLVE